MDGVDRRRAALIRDQGYHSMLAVPLRARGVTLGVVVFYRRSRAERMERFGPDDLLLAEELAARAAVAMDNARRYSRERETALSLQHSLLPQRMPEQAAVDAASRYIPAGAGSGIGGDWFDVIPLSGARVALVVGDVVGHGIRATATMGRLRTAVRTLSDVDLPPDELLTSLDDLVVRLSSEAGGDESGGEGGGEVGATCCYVIYDPVSRTCTMASAGHPPPVMMPPAGMPAVAPMSIGPPLGVGGLPFEANGVELPEGSLLALFSNGLIETRERDVDEDTSGCAGCSRAPARRWRTPATPSSTTSSQDDPGRCRPGPRAYPGLGQGPRRHLEHPVRPRRGRGCPEGRVAASVRVGLGR
ncbi:PP2C family protein-serine/threonine phosphatase [Streptacidiphilus monticola]